MAHQSSFFPPVTIAACLVAALLLVPLRDSRTRMQAYPLDEQEFAAASEIPDSGPLSRYDDIIKKHSAEIGWDWRLVAAIIYNESRFNNDANSGKGAQGLMQIISSRYSDEELNDPDRNIQIGTRYLRKLEKMYSKTVPVSMDRLKFVLASYNFGEGKIQRLIDQAREEGLDATRWDSVSTLLPAGHHTVSYVEKVLDTYRDYSLLYPAK